MINLFMPSKKTFILMGILITFIVILALVTSLSSPEPTLNPSPTPRVNASNPPVNNLPSQRPGATNRFEQIVEDKIAEKNYQRIVERGTLLETDQSVKSRLIATLQGSSGIVNSSDLFTIEYLQSPKYFMAQIKSADIVASKKAVTGWFLNEGLSQSGICNLPVILYLTPEVRDYLLTNDLKFDPIPEGCQ